MTFNLNLEIINSCNSQFGFLASSWLSKHQEAYNILYEFLYTSEKFVVTLTEWHTLRNTSFPISFRWVIRAKTLVYVRRLSFRLCFLYKVLCTFTPWKTQKPQLLQPSHTTHRHPASVTFSLGGSLGCVNFDWCFHQVMSSKLVFVPLSVC